MTDDAPNPACLTSTCGPDGECISGAVWRTSSRSSQVGECVEVAAVAQGVAVRDSKNPLRGHLHLRLDVWAAFAECVKAGGLDLQKP